MVGGDTGWICFRISTQIDGNLALKVLLGILKQIDPPVLDAASQDFHVSKLCAMLTIFII